MDTKNDVLYPDRASKLKKTWIGGAVFAFLAVTGFVGISSSTTVNGEVTQSSTLDLIKLIGGPIVAYIGARLVMESRQYAGTAASQLLVTGIAFVVLGLSALAWGITLAL